MALTVGELRQLLLQYEDCMPVVVCGLDGDGYCHASIEVETVTLLPANGVTCDFRSVEEIESKPQWRDMLTPPDGKVFTALYIG